MRRLLVLSLLAVVAAVPAGARAQEDRDCLATPTPRYTTSDATASLRFQASDCDFFDGEIQSVSLLLTLSRDGGPQVRVEKTCDGVELCEVSVSVAHPSVETVPYTVRYEHATYATGTVAYWGRGGENTYECASAQVAASCPVWELESLGLP